MSRSELTWGGRRSTYLRGKYFCWSRGGNWAFVGRGGGGGGLCLEGRHLSCPFSNLNLKSRSREASRPLPGGCPIFRTVSLFCKIRLIKKQRGRGEGLGMNIEREKN